MPVKAYSTYPFSCMNRRISWFFCPATSCLEYGIISIIMAVGRYLSKSMLRRISISMPSISRFRILGAPPSCSIRSFTATVCMGMVSSTRTDGFSRSTSETSPGADRPSALSTWKSSVSPDTGPTQALMTRSSGRACRSSSASFGLASTRIPLAPCW